jgi:hypothetical protein
MTLTDSTTDDRRIACIDLNGVLDSYMGWQGSDHFDPPRPGAHAFDRIHGAVS